MTGRYRWRRARTSREHEQALKLRARVFRGDADADDADLIDSRCAHWLIEDSVDDAPVCTWRSMILPTADGIEESYSAQYYDLTRLACFPGTIGEIGRFCIAPGRKDPDILRLAWAAMAHVVEAEGIGLLFGCSSFPGTDPARHRVAFDLLAEKHLGPRHWQPAQKAAAVVSFASGGARSGVSDRMRLSLPPLLRSYLAMGGWVGDHAVIDRDLGTMHVFTGLEMAAVPPTRRRSLRTVAGHVVQSKERPDGELQSGEGTRPD